MKPFPLLLILFAATILTGCKDQKKAENAGQTTETTDSIILPIGPKDMKEIYDSLQQDTLYFNHHFADRGMKQIYGFNCENEEGMTEDSKWFFHVWARKAELDVESFPEIRQFITDSEDAMGLVLGVYAEQTYMELSVFNDQAKSELIKQLAKEGFVEKEPGKYVSEKGDTISHGNKFSFSLTQTGNSQYTLACNEESSPEEHELVDNTADMSFEYPLEE